jgi:CSLREA domain-containing protein
MSPSSAPSRLRSHTRSTAFRRRLSLGLFAAALPALAAAATIHVTTLADLEAADGECSLREAIVAANDDDPQLGCPAGSGADRIEFDAAGVIALASDLPVITGDLTIAGPTPAPGDPPAVTLNGADHRMLVLNGMPNGRTLRIEHLTVRNGLSANPGGCILVREGDHLEVADSRVANCESLQSGGAVSGYYAASITVVRSTVRDSVAAYDSGGILLLGEGYEPPAPTAAPAGAEPTATLLLEDSTVSGNESSNEGAAGGIGLAFANGEIRRSTLSGNRTEDVGGGLVLVYGSLIIDSTTVSNNTADSDNDDTEEVGGGLYAVADEFGSSTIQLRNSVVGGNFAFALPSDVAIGDASAILSSGFNLIGVRDGANGFFPLGAPNTNDDWVGDRTSPVLAGLAPLADHGGPTPTQAPTAGSPIVDHGSCAGALRDQRGFGNPATQSRPVDQILVPDAADGCDIGAFEADAVALPISLFLDGFEGADTAAWSATAP